ncbi:sugar phosphate isomerase/epimerase family protein [Dactylosporangium siamense]|uniref:Xylose isomerase n=1 Tax=Dactylosporangium siamense TaxID=685454 RepID=A0A919PT94_9ACTN|nr:sugar phosphate isomerase/epimerase [Dactylosporangium siamense]GIG47973.1 xylose isomerase [Dactylosporangium siamense]
MPRSPALQLYTLRDAVGEDLRGTLRRVAAMGYREIELFGFVDRAEEMADALRETGLTAPAAHAWLIDNPEPAGTIEIAAGLGVEILVDPYTPAERWADAASIARTAERLNALARVARGTGVAIGYHNHVWELSSSVDGRHGLEVLAASLDPDVVLEVDTYWAAVGGADVPALLQRLGDRVRLLHIKDGPVTPDAELQQPVGSGRMPVEAILAAAPQARPIVELDAFQGDLFEAVETSLRHLSGIAA